MRNISKYTKKMSEAFIFWSNLRTNPYETVVFDLFDIYGKEFETYEKIVNYIFDQPKINLSDTNYISYIYKSFIPNISDDDIIKVFSNTVVLEECTSIEDFFLTTNNHILNSIKKEDPFVIDNDRNTLYTSKKYSGLVMQKSGLNFKLEQAKIPVWNMFDDLGDLVSLKRLPFETNVSYKKRILDVFIHLPGNHFNGLVNSIARETNIRTYLQWTDTRTNFIIKDKNIFVNSITIVYPNGTIEYPDVYTNEDEELVILALNGQIENTRISYANLFTIHDMNDIEDYFIKQFYYNPNKTARKHLTNFARQIRTNTYESFIMDQTYEQQKARNFLPSLYDGSVQGFKKYNNMTIKEIENKIMYQQK